MSEYQCYQWATVHRTLTTKQQEKVAGLSSHIEVSGSSAVVTYRYGDFKHDPIKVLARYFDVFSYEANWGSQIVGFRFDDGVVDLEFLSVYAVGDSLKITRDNGSLMVKGTFHSEEGSGWINSDEHFGSRFTDLHEEISNGDFRSIFILWLKAAELHQGEPGDPVPIPDGMSDLHEGHEVLIAFLELDPKLVKAAGSVNSRKKRRSAQPQNELKKALVRLPPERKQHFLEQLLEGPAAKVRAGLIGELLQTGPPKKSSADEIRVRFKDLEEGAKALKQEDERKAEKKRRKLRKEYLATVAESESRLWKEADRLISEKTTKGYDTAVIYLRGLQDLWTEQGKREAFAGKIQDLAARYPRLSGMKKRLEEAGLFEEKLIIEDPEASLWNSWEEEEEPEEIDFETL